MARINKIKQLKAQQQGQQSTVETQLVAGDLKHYQAALRLDLQKLKTVHDIAEKSGLKREMIKNYLPFVQQYMSLGHCYPNDVAVRVMVWLFDIADDVDTAVKLGLLLAKQGCHQMPVEFNRPIECFICDALYDWASNELKEKRSALPYIQQIAELVNSDWQVPDIVAGKVFAMLAKHLFEQQDYAGCIVWADKAEAVNPAAGVKTLRTKANDLLKKAVVTEPSKPSDVQGNENNVS
jgi:hypothetical protein